MCLVVLMDHEVLFIFASLRNHRINMNGNLNYFSTFKSTIKSGKPTLKSGKSTLKSGKPTLKSGKPTLKSGKPTLKSGKCTMKSKNVINLII